MKSDESRSAVQKIMAEFAERTGLSPAGKFPQRYLWTDAFAVCNFLEIYCRTGEEKYRLLALDLVDQVHNILGRHREDDPRTGWISGLDEKEGRIHPTKGGLRIGKKINERKPSDPYDENLEWDRDGQYYHYLTKWMHALNRVSRIAEDYTYNIWAIELAKTAHACFTYVPLSGGRRRMYWKMSIDLSRPLVQSMGHHDPLDGFITYIQLQAFTAETSVKTASDLNPEIADMADICEGKTWATDDPLGIGGILCDTYKLAQLISNEKFKQTGLMEELLKSSLLGLESYMRNNSLTLPSAYRLAFRELGLAIGLRAVKKLKVLIDARPDAFERKDQLFLHIEKLIQYISLCEIIEKFWLEDKNRKVPSWTGHRNINMVMLATSLAPDGFLDL
ncbi:MAG: hypothetical protein AVO38_03675 [delta proteobacterium ML8_D]|jgi:hypothetical protein|nr:MAG: hypothetical protein AVO38_03675 [delta proteobacterium ML8_D]